MNRDNSGSAERGFTNWRQKLVAGASCATLAAVTMCSPSAAQTWTGNGSNGSWANAGNWDTGAPVSNRDNELIFESNGQGFNPRNDIADGFLLRSITLTGDFTGRITGQSFSMITDNPVFWMESNADIVIDNDIDFLDEFNPGPWRGLYVENINSATGTVILAGNLSSPGDENLSRFGTFESARAELRGHNTYLGRTDVSDTSMLIAASDFALGAITGETIVSAGATLALRGDINLQEEVIHLSGQGVESSGALRNLSGSNTVLGGITLRGTTRIQSDADLLTLEGDLGGAHDLTFSGMGDITVNGSIEVGSVSVSGDGNVTFAGDISGNGGLNQTGGGVTVLTGTHSYAGDTTVSGGTLRAGESGVFSASSAFSVLNGGTLDLAGFSHTVNSLANAGAVMLAGTAATAGTPGITLTVAGNYAGDGGTIFLNTVLDGDGSASDRLIVQGDTSGTTNLRVTNVGGGGAQTQDGIKIVEVSGASDGTFTLLGDYEFEGKPALVAGAYAYRLYQGGIGTAGDGDWYLRSALNTNDPIFQASVPLYEAYAGTLQAFNELGTLQQRLGNRAWMEDRGPTDSDGLGVWARVDAEKSRIKPDTSATGTTYEPFIWKLEAGADTLLAETATGSLLGGVSVHYGKIDADITSAFGVGSIDAKGIGVGGSLTWYANDGSYVDGQVQFTWYDNDLRSATAGRDIANGVDSMGYAVGIEIGRQIALDGNWSLTPQAQFAYSAIDFDEFTGVFSETVSPAKNESLITRLGVALNHQAEWSVSGKTTRSHFYGIANLYNELENRSRVDVAGTAITSEGEALWGGIGVGGSLSWDDDRFALYGEGLAKTGLKNFGDSHVISGSIGFRVRW